MWKCIRCNKENQDSIENCAECGHGKSMNYISYRTLSKVQESITENWKVEQNTPQYFMEQGREHLQKVIECFYKINMENKNIWGMTVLELNQYFKNEESIETAEIKPTLMADNDGKKVLGSDILREDITQIEFVKNRKNSFPDGAWDVSEDRSKTIWAWIEDRDNEKILKIGSRNGVYANSDCESFFQNYTQVTKISFNKLISTKNVRNMWKMFADCYNLEKIDVSNFDTSNVIDMGMMFDSCYNLQKVDVSGFDTSNVGDMSYMFCDCRTLEELDVSNFNVKSVAVMTRMFGGCHKLKNLDISNFNIDGDEIGVESIFDGSGIELSTIKLIR